MSDDGAIPDVLDHHSCDAGRTNKSRRNNGRNRWSRAQDLGDRAAYWRTDDDSAAAPSWALPNPPGDDVRYAYLGRQHRWLFVVQFVAFVGVAVSFVQFSTESYLTLPLLLPLALFSMTSVISLRSSSRKRRIGGLDEHVQKVRDWCPAGYPTVDVFLPSAGESEDILANTYTHVEQLCWPSAVTVYVLDDSARDSVRALAQDHDFVYLTRPDRGHLKKAGNLKYGYEHSFGDIIAIFDADFVPRPDYLFELVPYFDDEQVGIVQSPQYFDTPRDMSWLQRTAGATQELFYRFVQPSRDRVDAAICVGTCGLYRRSALEISGGFAQIGHSEDVHTGVNLLKVGKIVRYVPVIASTGLCPDRISAFLTQQYRWCTGSMSLLADPGFHLHPRLTARQRLSFWSGFLYYIGTALNAFVAPLPLLAMVWLFPDLIRPQNSIPLLGAVVLWFFVLPSISHARWRPDVLRIQTLYSFAHAVAIYDLLRAKAAEWVPTNLTRSTPLAVKIMRTTVVWLTASALLSWVGIAVAMAGSDDLERFWPMLCFAAFRAYINLPILHLCLTADDGVVRRITGRHRVRVEAGSDPGVRAAGVQA